MAKIISSTINLGSLLNKGAMLAQNSQSQYNKLTNHLNNPHIKTHQVYEIDKDLLSLSVCWKRYRDIKDDTPRPYIGSLLEAELFRCVTDLDVELANRIRDYYSKKLMMWALKSERELTQFRKDLRTFITSEGKIFQEEMLPLAFRLPELYEYDLFVDDRIHESKEFKANLHPNQYLFLGKINRTTRKQKKIEFWFLNYQQALCRLVLEPNNILIPILENLIDSSSDRIFVSNAKLQKRMRDDLVHFDFITLA